MVDRATEKDASQITDVISDAFLGDPTWSWAFPDPTVRRLWWTFCIQEALRYPWIFKTEGYETVSVDFHQRGPNFLLKPKRVYRTAKRIRRHRRAEVWDLLERFGAAHPRDVPHYYLSLLGTRDEHRGRGLGLALLEENLARIDAEHMPAYLESSNPKNNHRYEAVGFVSVASFQAPGGGPVVTGMWRDSR